MGTISELALGSKWGKRVLTLHADLALPGATACRNVPALLTAVMGYLVEID
jgi:hypothetical protein